MVKLILREKEFEVRPGMTLQSALKKCDVLSESVIATREGELILDDEILNDGDVIKLVAVISGGTGIGSWELGLDQTNNYRLSNNEVLT